MLIVDEASKLGEHNYDNWFKFIDTSQGLYIGVGVEEQNILRVTAYGRELSKRLLANYGFYIQEGEFSIIKLIEFERMEENDDDEE